MSDGKKYYCFCGSNCKYETMTKEQILAAITQAVENGSVGNCDTGFITKVKEQNGGSCVTFWVGTQAQYNAIETKEQNCLYIITDDTTNDDIRKVCENATAAAAEANATAAAANALAKNAHGIATQLWENDNKNVCVNFTNKLAFSAAAGGENLTEAYATPIRYKYDPRTGIVHFVAYLHYRGKMEKGEGIIFYNVGNPYPPIFANGGSSETGYTYPICTRGYKFVAEYIDYRGEPAIAFYAQEAIDTQSIAGGFTISGWYFAEAYNVGDEDEGDDNNTDVPTPDVPTPDVPTPNEPTYVTLEPVYVEEKQHVSTDGESREECFDDLCDVYRYEILGMTGRTVKIRTVLHENTGVYVDDCGTEFEGEDEVISEYFGADEDGNNVYDFTYNIQSDHCNIDVTCVREYAAGLLSVSVSEVQ